MADRAMIDEEKGGATASITSKANVSHVVEDVEAGKSEIEPQSPIFALPPTVHADYNAHNSAADRALLWRQDVRLVPLTSFCYLLCYLDRSNIGNAKVLNADAGNDLLTETRMDNYQYTIALMVFLISYTIFEVPSNYLLKKTSPSRWIAFLMFSWGAITIGLGGAQNFATVTAVRFLLGIFEAGLFPGLIYYFTFWYRSEERSLRAGLMIGSASLAGAFGGAIAYGVGHMNGTSGLSAWRWLFILEGIPSCLSAMLIYFCLPDYPETARWLSDAEKALAAERLRLDGSKGSDGSLTWKEAKETLTEWRLYAHYALYFGISAPYSSLSLFTPSITGGLNYVGLQAQLMTVPPYAVAYVVTIAVAWSADHFNARALHSACLATIGAVGFLASAVLPADAYVQRYGCLIVGTVGSFSCIPPLLGWLSSNMFNTAATGLAIAMNVSLGAPGQITGVWIYKADEKTKGYPTGHWVNAGLLFFVAVGGLGLRSYYRMLNRRTQRGGGDRLYVY
ncbi:major facilitator superfamily domain-containing protein [Phyllosticta citribraziliensis]